MTDSESDIDVFSDKIAGHFFTVGAKAGIAKEKSSGRILKLVDGDERGRRELSFYEAAFHADDDNHKQLRNFLPRFLGRRVILNREFIVLEDVSCGSRNVMDVKIGAVTWDHLASEEKIASEKNKFKFGMDLGFRMQGYRVTDASGHMHILTKSEGKLLPGSQMRQVLDIFLSPDDQQLREFRRKQYVKQLHQVRDLMSQEKRYSFISSSLLFAYGRPAAGGDELVKLSVIDFAHTFRLHHDEERVDQNYLNGLNSLLTFIETRP